jgi:hypothetical protein
VQLAHQLAQLEVAALVGEVENAGGELGQPLDLRGVGVDHRHRRGHGTILAVVSAVNAASD